MGTFTVIYYVGGTDRGQWRVTSPRHADRKSALAYAETINKQGYYTLIHETAKLKAIGLPEGAPSDLLKWQHEHTHIKAYCGCKQV